MREPPRAGCPGYSVIPVREKWLSFRAADAIQATTSRKERLLSQSQYLLKLYVTGKTPKAEVAIANLRRICDEELQGKYELQIIDVLEHPQAAEDDKILATPTLIKRLPPPLRRVIGDLSDKHKVLLGLEVRPQPAASLEVQPQATIPHTDPTP
jgi:circadian clock protein KaiB